MKKLLVLSILFLVLPWCSLQQKNISSDTIQIIGNKRYTPRFPTRTWMWADDSGRLYGQFSHFRSERLGIAFDYVSDDSISHTKDDDTTMLMIGKNSIYKDMVGSPRVFMMIFTWDNIGSSMSSIRKFFGLGGEYYPMCGLSKGRGYDEWDPTINKRNLTWISIEQGKKDWDYYSLFYSWEVNGSLPTTPACPQQKSNYDVPILLINKHFPNTIIMTFGCEGCWPWPDFSWIPTLEILK